MKVIKQSAHIVTDWPKMNLYERCEFAGRISHASEDKIKEGSAEEFVRRMVKLGHESVFEFARVVRVDIGEWHMRPTFVNVRKLRETLKRADEDQQVGMNIDGLDWIIATFLAKKYPVFFEDIQLPRFWGGVESVVPGLNVQVEEANDWIPVVIVTNRAISHQLVRYRKDVVYLQASQRYIMLKNDVDFIDPGVYFPEIGSSYQQESRAAWEDAMLQAEKVYKTLVRYGEPAQAARLVLPNSAATKLIMYASPDTWRHVFEQRISDKADPMIRELLEPLKEEFVKEGLL